MVVRNFRITTRHGAIEVNTTVHEYIPKEFTLDEERQKHGGKRYIPSPYHRSYHSPWTAVVAEFAEIDALPRAEV